MKISLTHEEILEACAEWAERHHGIRPEGKPKIVATIIENKETAYEINRMAIEFPAVVNDKSCGPYRTPG